MTEKIQTIFLKLIRDLKRDKWIPSPDWEITLKSEGQVSLQKNINVSNYIGDREVKEEILTNIDVKMASNDNITFFPEYTIYANIMLNGLVSEDVTYKSEANVAFTEHDFGKDEKINQAAGSISRQVGEYIDGQFNDYCSNHNDEISNYHLSGEYKADNEEDDFR
jgi:hypothetical protein